MHTLTQLPYSKDALSPVIDETTVEIHYGKHHQTYVNKLNELITGTEFENLSLEDTIKQAPKWPIFNNAAQVWNHTFYWNNLQSPQANNVASGNVAQAITAKRGSFEAFVTAFNASAVGNFGSGWTRLVKTAEGNLEIVNTSNAETPLTSNTTAILTVDVWEHAYYLNYQNRRPDYLGQIRSIINRSVVEDRFNNA